RTFASGDPLVADVANAIEARYPGHVVGVNTLIGPEGELGSEADIVLQNAVIQVKSRGGKGATSQAVASQHFTDLPVIVYGPNLGIHVQRSLRAQGILVTTDRNVLLQTVKP